MCLLFFPLKPFAAENGEAALVVVEQAVQIEVSQKTWLPGTVMGRFDSKISAEVDGRLEQLLDVGDRVLSGDVLAKVESLTLSLHVDEM